MTEDILAEFRGNIYQSESHWCRGLCSRFVVIKIIRKSVRDPLVEIELLDNPKYRSCQPLKPGHAAVSLSGIRKCKKIGYMDIMEYMKSKLL